MTEIELMALEYALEYVKQVPPDQWNLSPENQQWLREIFIKLEQFKEVFYDTSIIPTENS